ncbi:MAG: hypothetical protein A2X30_04745 [Elusimicrobia bacterium GWB2_63_16]|nr:MAG: hypothetical protein A2X30_04745 [Elusimicrobia bacterium GWB2_63_16]
MSWKTPVRALLFGFVALSAGAILYRAAGFSSSGESPVPPAAALVEAPAAEKPPVKTAAAAKTAVVYYFYTNTRCSSCTTIEAYTREAVEKKLAPGYKGWRVEFRGVNVDEKANEHFVRDYWLNSKAVIVQKFAGDKALKWGKLDRVWTLIGDKDAFLDYVAVETRKLLDLE